MADEPATTTTTEPAEPAEPVTQPKEPQTVPYDRFAQVNQQAKDAQKQLKEMQDRLQELEDRDKSELERERSQRERAQQEKTDLEQRLVSLERGQWVRAAAQAAKFVDVDDAVAHLDLAGIESERDAKKAVEKLAERKQHLVRQEPQRPEIGQVLKGGQPPTDTQGDPKDYKAGLAAELAESLFARRQ